MFQKLIRETASVPVVHLWQSQGIAACGRHVGLASVWTDDDRKLTCPACRAIRDESESLNSAVPADRDTVEPGLSTTQQASSKRAKGPVDLARQLLRVDPAPQHRQPRAYRIAVASVVAVVGSLGADALLVALGKAVFPSTG